MYKVVKALSSFRILVIVLLFVGWTISYSDRFIMNFAIPLIGTEFNIGPASQGIILSSFFAGYALMQIPSGWLLDRYGFRWVIIISIFMFSIFTFLTGFAWSVMSLIVIRFIFGMGESGLTIGAVKAITEYFPKHERSRAQSIIFSSQPLSLVISPILAGLLITWLGWRSMFFIFALVGCVIGLLYWKYLKPKAESRSEVEEPKTIVSIIYLLRNPEVWKLMAVNFGINILTWGFISWLPSYMLQVQKLDIMHAGILSSLPGLAGIVAVLISGWVNDKFFGNREKYLVVVGIMVSAACLFMMINSASLLFVVICQIALVFSIKFAWTSMWAIPLKLIDPTIIGSVTGLISFASQIAGILSPSIMGFLISYFQGSYQAAFVFLIVSALVSAVFCLFIRSSKEISAANAIVEV